MHSKQFFHGDKIRVHLTRKPSGQINDMRLLTTFILLTICLTATGQTSPTRNWVDSEVKYTASPGKVVILQNSLPKGGGGYTDSGEKSIAKTENRFTQIVNFKNRTVDSIGQLYTHSGQTCESIGQLYTRSRQTSKSIGQ
jgi:hypothetical protein